MEGSLESQHKCSLDLRWSVRYIVSPGLCIVGMMGLPRLLAKDLIFMVPHKLIIKRAVHLKGGVVWYTELY